jgi:hypothetical protein
MPDLYDGHGEHIATDTFSMDCPNCGPSTIHFLGGEAVPHGCDYVPPSIVIDCTDDDQ